MQLFIQGQELHVLDVTECESVTEIKERVAKLEELSPEDIALYYQGSPLTDSSFLSRSISSLSTLQIEVRLLGGKVHGSLARAGKVKGQTPKVEKQEKKKQKTGRAKRRQQYNRRFVNAVTTFGRKKGPNSNSA